MKTNKKEPVILGNIDPNKGNIWAGDEISAIELDTLYKNGLKRYARHITIQNMKAAKYHRDFKGMIKQFFIYLKNV